MLGVMIGVMTLNIALSIMTGFEVDLRDRILGFNPHVVVVSYSGSIVAGDKLLEKVRAVDGVVSAAPFVYDEVMVSNQQYVSGVVVAASTLAARRRRRRALPRPRAPSGSAQVQVPATDGTRAASVPGIIIGKAAAAAQRQRRRSISVISRSAPSPSVAAGGRFVVASIFSSGAAEYDATLVCTSVAVRGSSSAGRRGHRHRGARKDLYRAREIGTRTRLSAFLPERGTGWRPTRTSSPLSASRKRSISSSCR